MFQHRFILSPLASHNTEYNFEKTNVWFLEENLLLGIPFPKTFSRENQVYEKIFLLSGKFNKPLCMPAVPVTIQSTGNAKTLRIKSMFCSLFSLCIDVIWAYLVSWVVNSGIQGMLCRNRYEDFHYCVWEPAFNEAVRKSNE